ncbi:MAG: SWIM zinc finger family protein [Ignavibacteriales bacterium]
MSIGSNGFFKVSGFEVDTEKMQCECPDYKTRKEACKHLLAAMLFVRNRRKQTIEDLDGYNGNGNGSTHKDVESAKDVSKPFDRQSTITRLAVLNTATEILKTHSKPIEFSDIVSLVAQLEKWALGN